MVSQITTIAWSDSTVNFWRGCDKVSAGCKNCYITTTTPFRVSGMRHGEPRVLSEGAFKLAHSLNRKPWICDDCGKAHDLYENAVTCPCQIGQHEVHRRRIFSLSLGDIWDRKVSANWRARALNTILSCADCQWILCSKRWEEWARCLSDVIDAWGHLPPDDLTATNLDIIQQWLDGQSPTHIIGLCSVENQEWADKRIPQFLAVPLACRGLSIEPLLGLVDLQMTRFSNGQSAWKENVLRENISDWARENIPAIKNLHQPIINWIIIGGESGKDRREMKLEWMQSLAKQGQSAGVPVFIKQDSGAKPGEQGRIPDALWKLKQFPKGF